MKTFPRSAPIIQLLSIGTDIAVENAVQDAHDVDPSRFHDRYKLGDKCMRCAPDDSISAQVDAIMHDSGLVLEPWQRKLANEVLEAKSAEMDAVVDQAEPSPALKAYLEEHELVPDTVAVGSYAELTAKQLRPLASAAGMKGARVAKKAELVEFMENTGCGCTGQ